MFAPYVRIIPMHLTIILGGFVGIIGSAFSINADFVVLSLFILIKTGVDVITHSIEFDQWKSEIPETSN
jgi:hypothetical protein